MDESHLLDLGKGRRNRLARRESIIDIYLIMTPPMTGGKYAGFLPSNLWPELNAKT